MFFLALNISKIKVWIKHCHTQTDLCALKNENVNKIKEKKVIFVHTVISFPHSYSSTLMKVKHTLQVATGGM